MRTIFFSLITLLACACHQSNQPSSKRAMDNPVVTIKTNKGDFQVELFPEQAPVSVKNFLTYVDEKFYDHTVFHRVINGFMIQGGGFDKSFKNKPTHDPIKNEAQNNLSNKRGTVAMARTSDVHSATAQFFVNVSDNEFLNHQAPSPSGYGYCVFGKVVSGMDVVDQIKEVQTASLHGHQDVPTETIEILEVVRKPS